MGHLQHFIEDGKFMPVN